MAEGNNFLCEPCEQKTTITSATTFCTDCGVGYCDDCVKIHQVALPLRTHYLTSIANYTKIAPLSGLYICSEHQRQHEFVCQQHDVVLCLKCVQTDHTKCDISALSEASKGVKTSYAAYNIEADIDNIINNLEKSVKTVNAHINNLKNKNKTIKESVDVMYVNSDKDKDNALRELKFKFEKCFEKLHKSRSQFQEKLQSIKKLQTDFSTLKIFSSEKQTCIAIKRISQEVHNEKQAVKKMFNVFQIFGLNCKADDIRSGVNLPVAIDITTENDRLQFTEKLQQAQIDTFLFSISYKRRLSFTDYLAVIGIEMGTKHTEVGMSFRSNNFKINRREHWESETGKRFAKSAPTCILLEKEDKRVVAFGYQALEMYTTFVEYGEESDYHFFDSIISREDMSKDSKLSDTEGNTLPATDVIKLVIKELSRWVLDEWKLLTLKDCVWVFTMPSQWTEKGKELLQESAYMKLDQNDSEYLFEPTSCTGELQPLDLSGNDAFKSKVRDLFIKCKKWFVNIVYVTVAFAIQGTNKDFKQSGIPRSNVITVLRPEAALVFFQYQGLSKETELFTIKNRDTCLVVDIGGEREEITVFKRESEELISVDCFPTTVQSPVTSYTQNILSLFETIFGKRVLTKLSKEYQICYVDLLDEIHNRGFRKSLPTHNIRIPVPELNKCCLEILQTDIKDVVQSRNCQTVLRRDVLCFDRDLIIPIFETESRHIIQEIRKVLHRLQIKTFKSLVLVGDYSDNSIIQHEIKLVFPDIQLLTGQLYQQEVICGAVLFGHKPDVLAQGVNHHIYG